MHIPVNGTWARQLSYQTVYARSSHRLGLNRPMGQSLQSAVAPLACEPGGRV